MTFDEAYAVAAPYSLLDAQRMALLWKEATSVPPGDFAEVGVYKGGSAMLLRAAGPDRVLHLFDTFAGHPAQQVPGLDDGHWAGRFNDTSAEAVGERVGDCELYVGPFPVTLPDAWARKLALVHIDVDLYHSTRDALYWLVTMIVPGGVCICDDYGTVPGAKQAVEEFAEDAREWVTLETPSTGQAVLRVA